MNHQLCLCFWTPLFSSSKLKYFYKVQFVPKNLENENVRNYDLNVFGQNFLEL